MDQNEKASLVGRPTSFRPEYVEQARKLAQLGAVDVEIADFFGVCRRTLHAWRSTYPELAEAMKVGKDAADDRVEHSLFHRALGYSHPAVKIMVADKVVVREDYVEHYPPDTAAAIFWLKNRRKTEWRDKVEHEHGGGFNVTFSGAAADL